MFRVWGSGFKVSGFGFRASGFGFRVAGFRFRFSNFGLGVPGFRFRVSGVGFRVSGFRCRADDPIPRHYLWVRPCWALERPPPIVRRGHGFAEDVVCETLPAVPCFGGWGSLSFLDDSP